MHYLLTNRASSCRDGSVERRFQLDEILNAMRFAI